MVDKLNNLIRGIGSVVALFPEERDLSVKSHTASSSEEAFAMDADALRGNFEHACEQIAEHVEEAKQA